MTIKTASPGVIINEVDLTKGTSDAITTNVGAFVGPFERGPVKELVLVSTEAEFQRIFGNPTDANYEYWYTVANFLEYGGVCYVVRADDAVGDSSGEFLQTMKNSSNLTAAELAAASEEQPYIKNELDFEENWLYSSATSAYVGRTPGTWTNGLGVTVIDQGADYEMNTAVNVAATDTDPAIESNVFSTADGTAAPATQRFDKTTAEADNSVGRYVKLKATDSGSGIVVGDLVSEYDGAGSPVVNGAKGFVMGIANGYYHVCTTTTAEFQQGNTLSTDGLQETGTIAVRYRQGDFLYYDSEYYIDLGNEQTVNTIWDPQTYELKEGIEFGWPAFPTANQKVNSGGPCDAGDTYIWSERNDAWINVYEPQAGDFIHDGSFAFKLAIADDWYSKQVAFQGIPWYRFAGRPGTTANAVDRGARNDEMHIIVYDAEGNFTGTKGNILESYFGVSKLAGARTQEGDLNYYKDVINRASSYIYTLGALSGGSSNLNQGLSAIGTQMGDGVVAAYTSPIQYTLRGGVDNYNVSLGELQDGYNMLDVEALPDLDYILQGPGMSNLNDSIAKANFIISIAENRRDCMAFLSPYRGAVIGKSSIDATEAIVEWARELSSSSYAVFDSGYKYTYDRFNDQYRYLPLNGDIAGLLANASLTSEAWYSPAGLSRGQIRNVVKLPYNPSKTQRDQLYTNRVNSVVTFPGEGTMLFGDKTALGYSSAFDRINVRKLFLVIEKEIAKISRTVLFEFNDETTRSLFKNNVNPYLRDIQSKRGMYDFLVVCDTTNNTPEVQDRNEFIADIYIKPTKSVNFISLNFIATKTGVSFDESVALFRGN